MVSQPHLPVVKRFSFHCYQRPTQTGSCTAANPHTLAFCTHFKLLLPQPSLLKSRSREISSICPVPMSESDFNLNCKGPVRKPSQEVFLKKKCLKLSTSSLGRRVTKEFIRRNPAQVVLRKYKMARNSTDPGQHRDSREKSLLIGGVQ